ncbi:hypothetical protein, partial [Nocardiopsis gilva]
MAKAAALTDHWLGPLSRPGARWARRAHLTPSGLGRIGLVLTVPAAVWFTEPGPRGALIGSLFLAAALCTDAVAGELVGERRDALEAWLTAMLSRLREYIVYLGLAIAGTLSGVPDAWGWAAGTLIAVALRDSVVAAHRARPDLSGPPQGVVVPAQPRGGGCVSVSLIDAVDPSGTTADRSPSDPTLTAELFGTATSATADGEGGSGADRDDRRERPPRPDAPAAVSAGTPPPTAARRLLAFPQAARFATVALTITIWDPRVTFIA